LVDEAGELASLFTPKNACAPVLKGKQVRARLLLLAARALDALNDDAVSLAAALEMIHNASLLHDDVIDGATKRRGATCLHVEHGARVAIMVGDLFFARAMALVCRCDKLPVYQAVSRAVVDLAAGQVADSQDTRDGDTDLNHYFAVVDRKTGSLVSLCLELPAILAGLPPGTQRELSEAGRLLGRLFQAADDLLDLNGDHEHTGKDSLQDLRQGKLTFPYLVLLELCDESERAALRAQLRSGDADPAYVAELARRHQLLAAVRPRLEAWIEQITARFRAVPRWQDQGAFLDFCRRLAERRY
jgi:geranylgeranyl pyrophosphate synthase